MHSIAGVLRNTGTSEFLQSF